MICRTDLRANFVKKHKFTEVMPQRKRLLCCNEKTPAICNQHINYTQMLWPQSSETTAFQLNILLPQILITLFICFQEQMKIPNYQYTLVMFWHTTKIQTINSSRKGE